eukprot:TRINITY_DN6696_c0_g1_i1.p1 TRINITY_DN6696_c0_g1~~TRINITY_DN6696_c0_g1_i1.p1  ORF type:complete len:158 (-),score=50.99 TRINITY_DN6696_c0_g1_i1:95-568(-)
MFEQDGKVHSSEDFKGQHMLVYFGFTNCPDICPAELEKMAQMVTDIDADEETGPLQPIFITIDPKRDTPAIMKEYATEFHPRFLALSGDEATLKAVAKAYRVYYSIPDDIEEGEDYLVDHSIIMYLMGPDGTYKAHFGQNSSAEQATKECKKLMLEN